MSVQAMPSEAADQPILEMNTTPLIDVMLVLLIMLIITIPLQTHAVKVDLPQSTGGSVDAVKNKITVNPAGTIFWNGTAVSLAAVARNLERTKTMFPRPELHLQPDPMARYERVDEVLAVTKRAEIEKMGFVGNENYRRF